MMVLICNLLSAIDRSKIGTKFFIVNVGIIPNLLLCKWMIFLTLYCRLYSISEVFSNLMVCALLPAQLIISNNSF